MGSGRLLLVIPSHGFFRRGVAAPSAGLRAHGCHLTARLGAPTWTVEEVITIRGQLRDLCPTLQGREAGGSGSKRFGQPLPPTAMELCAVAQVR